MEFVSRTVADAVVKIIHKARTRTCGTSSRTEDWRDRWCPLRCNALHDARAVQGPSPESQRVKTRERTCGPKLFGVNFSRLAHVRASVMPPKSGSLCSGAGQGRRTRSAHVRP